MWLTGFWILLNVAHVVLAVIAIIKLIGTDMKAVNKILWAVLIIFLPLFGSVIFFLHRRYCRI